MERGGGNYSTGRALFLEAGSRYTETEGAAWRGLPRYVAPVVSAGVRVDRYPRIEGRGWRRPGVSGGRVRCQVGRRSVRVGLW